MSNPAFLQTLDHLLANGRLEEALALLHKEREALPKWANDKISDLSGCLRSLRQRQTRGIAFANDVQREQANIHRELQGIVAGLKSNRWTSFKAWFKKIFGISWPAFRNEL